MDLGIKNGNVFNGKGVVGKVNIYVKDGKIVEISKENKQAKIEIDAKDMFVMPGLIDAHIHLTGIKGGSLLKTMFEKPEYRVLRASKWLEKLLLAGFTTVRDCGETISLALKRGVSEGIINGPRIIAAGKPISQTFGHGELSHDVPLEFSMALSFSEFCDGVESCIRASRKVLRDGADFIKIFATGGVLSQRDRPEHPQLSYEEISAIVNEAEKINTYVAAHAHGDKGARIAVEAGIKTLEHGTLLRDETLKLMRERNVTLTPTLTIQELIYKYGKQIGVDEWGLQKINEVRESVVNVVKKAEEYGVMIITGTDLGFETGLEEIDIGKNWMESVLLVERGGLSTISSLRASTYNSAFAIGINAGAIEVGKDADIIVIDGDPTENIRDLSKVRRVVKNGKLTVEDGKFL
ncbi:amidohydrolase family protein [Saccharolobus solfataricus]|uniref:Prolidase (Xaa-Pro dipeptidase) (PepQ-like3) n=3 Tax=Saccharolobus solfataricus TaxID=2287 RepID=Q97VT3_SACS2|nr:amidohydrolase family protein [Saccharolobus solfataricus]AAK42657.1 Prolidase (Xaa-Pro dipeptidase) (pepQ-like3) [Saccharolobus solfataricus P2]AKA72753.1 amidohydrolase family protein [Saccharolobus solfataricus]AKA75452.1 amidohydrolase family protein [Saccharolobus solfataricus]AKA78145.1 amidohydrolase family protein [Saccharolobus solfataricus]AZF67264.1 amidohydrolase family protein [Saccharolobus solfataricus]